MSTNSAEIRLRAAKLLAELSEPLSADDISALTGDDELAMRIAGLNDTNKTNEEDVAISSNEETQDTTLVQAGTTNKNDISEISQGVNDIYLANTRQAPNAPIITPHLPSASQERSTISTPSSHAESLSSQKQELPNLVNKESQKNYAENIANDVDLPSNITSTLHVKPTSFLDSEDTTKPLELAEERSAVPSPPKPTINVNDLMPSSANTKEEAIHMAEEIIQERKLQDLPEDRSAIAAIADDDVECNPKIDLPVSKEARTAVDYSIMLASEVEASRKEAARAEDSSSQKVSVAPAVVKSEGTSLSFTQEEQAQISLTLDVRDNASMKNSHSNSPSISSNAAIKDIRFSQDTSSVYHSKSTAPSILSTTAVIDAHGLIQDRLESPRELSESSPKTGESRPEEKGSISTNGRSSKSSQAPNASSTSKSVAHAQAIESYVTKKIQLQPSPEVPARTLRIVLQNENGPCCLIAVLNALIIKEQIQLEEQDRISSVTLTGLLGDYLLKHRPSQHDPNWEHNLQDLLNVLPSIQKGMDVNIQFSDVSAFEMTPQMLLFDMIKVRLFHAWIPDPAQAETSRYLQNVCKSFNGAQNLIVQDPEAAFLAVNFFEENPMQSTPYGLDRLADKMNIDETAILFRNNHFSTVWKGWQGIATLVTDVGFVDEAQIVWETLQGDMLNGCFASPAQESVDTQQTPAPSAIPSSNNQQKSVPPQSMPKQDSIPFLAGHFAHSGQVPNKQKKGCTIS